MAPSQQFRVLRCCSCSLFQVHQVKKSLKWTCKACGEKQSFLRAYGEGSGADCRRHVQKLNLLQGQVSELSLRKSAPWSNTSTKPKPRPQIEGSLEAAVSAGQEGNAGGQLAKDGSPQGKSKPLENRWLKYLDNGSSEQELRECFYTQPSPNMELPGPPFSQALPRKRKWSQSTAQPPQSLDVQDSDNTEVTSEPQEGNTGLTRMVQQGSSHYLQNSAHCHTMELGFPRWKLPSLAPQVKVPSSKWARFLLSPGNSSHVDMELPRSLQRGPGLDSPAQAEQGILRTETPRESHPSEPTTAIQHPQATLPHTSRPERPYRKTPAQSWCTEAPQAKEGSPAQGVQRAPPVQLCNLFSTGEEFLDDL